MILHAIAGTFVIAYLLGSIPFGLLLGFAGGIGDVRKLGSGNIGATNVIRTGRKGLGILTLLLDAGKGFAAVYFVRGIYGEDFAALAGLFAVLGHIFPVWLRFKGGKGVATAIGILFALHWFLGLTVCLLWLAAFLWTRTASLASMLSIGYSSTAAYLLGEDSTTLLCLIFGALILFTHRSNIKRLLAGTEHSFQESAP